MSTTKVCTTCIEEKEVGEFYSHDAICKTCKKEANKNYGKENRESILKNRKENKERTRKYKRERYRTDPQFKLMHNLRRRILYALNGKAKSASTLELLGCSIQQLKDHLESQFTEGMTWENQGQWHVDHIRPCSSFKLEDPEEQKKCCNFRNLQPLWAHDNLSKGAKLDWTMT